MHCPIAPRRANRAQMSDAVRAELGRCGVNASLILTDVRHAENRKRSRSHHTETLDSLTDRLKVELIVGDRQVQRAVEAITQYGQVGLPRVNESLQIVPALSNTRETSARPRPKTKTIVIAHVGEAGKKSWSLLG
jgi:nitrogen regulatory protein PII